MLCSSYGVQISEKFFPLQQFCKNFAKIPIFASKPDPMITFLVCLALLVTAYFVYGGYLCRLCGVVDARRGVPSAEAFDGVDYMPLPLWKTFLIQLLNIAGLGPIFGAVLGAAYGPVAFVWITLGGIFMGGMQRPAVRIHIAAASRRQPSRDRGRVLGSGARRFMRLFAVGLMMVLVGAVFLSQPATLIAGAIDIPALAPAAPAWGGFSRAMLAVLGAILIYYVTATLLPIDRIIGRFYPVFGFLLFFMAAGILGVLLFGGRYSIPELTSLRAATASQTRSAFPIVPMLFTTIACGALSGFHATQSPLMARCLQSERQCRAVFYGAMISESIIALIWAAAAMAFWNGTEGLNGAIAACGGQAAVLVERIAEGMLGRLIAPAVIFGVVACGITSGDTAFRSARLIVADMLGLEQRSPRRPHPHLRAARAAGLAVIFFPPFGAIWSYFAWMNQTLAAITLWMIAVWLRRRRRNVWVALVPALFMTYICASYASSCRPSCAAWAPCLRLMPPRGRDGGGASHNDPKKYVKMLTSLLEPTPDQTFEIGGTYDFVKTAARAAGVAAHGPCRGGVQRALPGLSAAGRAPAPMTRGGARVEPPQHPCGARTAPRLGRGPLPDRRLRDVGRHARTAARTRSGGPPGGDRAAGVRLCGARRTRTLRRDDRRRAREERGPVGADALVGIPPRGCPAGGCAARFPAAASACGSRSSPLRNIRRTTPT